MEKLVRSFSRQAIALGVYRFAVTLFLLVALFNAFPGYRVASALAVLFIGAGFQVITTLLTYSLRVGNAAADIAERKTRHTILLAAERAGQPNLNEPDFWHEVDRRVEDERPRDALASMPWRGAGAIAWAIARLAIEALVLVILAGFLTPGI